MVTKYRVFGSNDVVPAPGVLIERCLADSERPLSSEFRPGEEGWFHGVIGDSSSVLVLDRWLAEEEEIRAWLNGWAAAVESWEGDADFGPLMERIVQTKQVFLLTHVRRDAAGERWPLRLAQLIAEMTGGVYHADDEGFFTAGGELLAAEPP
jgi:hypothetical protein